MPQSPLGYGAVNAAGQLAPTFLDKQNSERVSTTPQNTALGITTPTIVKAGTGRLDRVNVIVAGTGAGGVYDCLTTAAASAMNQMVSIQPLSTAQIGSLTAGMIAQNGICVLPGTGQTIAVSYE